MTHIWPPRSRGARRRSFFGACIELHRALAGNGPGPYIGRTPGRPQYGEQEGYSDAHDRLTNTFRANAGGRE